MQAMQVKLLHFIRRHELLAGGERAVVGLSGGADSVALVLLLMELTRSGALDVRLHLAHLNHGLRGAESDQDEAFCRAFAAERGLALTVERADVASAASLHHRSLEAEARRMRYEFLGRVAEQVGAGAVATGHHADDVAESVLLRLLRGASVLGLGAMAPQRPLSAERPGIRLIRPLLALRRQELLDYLDRCGQPHRTDSSNADIAYLRNRVRHELIPALQRDFGTFSVESLCALNESAIEAEALIEGLLEAAWGEVCRERGDREVVLDAAAFGRLAPPVRKAAARRAVESLDARAAAALRAEHYAELAALAQAPAGAQVSLPGGCLARREHGAVYIARRRGAGGIEPRALPVPGAVELPEVGMSVSCRLLPAGDVGPREAARRACDDEVFVSAAGLEGGLRVRSRRAGDRFHPLGAPGAAKLKDFLINCKVPQHERDRVPLVTTREEEIVWVVGKRIAQPFRLTDAAGRALHLRAAALEREDD